MLCLLFKQHRADRLLRNGVRHPRTSFLHLVAARRSYAKRLVDPWHTCVHLKPKLSPVACSASRSLATDTEYAASCHVPAPVCSMPHTDTYHVCNVQHSLVCLPFAACRSVGVRLACRGLQKRTELSYMHYGAKYPNAKLAFARL